MAVKVGVGAGAGSGAGAGAQAAIAKAANDGAQAAEEAGAMVQELKGRTLGRRKPKPRKTTGAFAPTATKNFHMQMQSMQEGMMEEGDEDEYSDEED